MPVSGGRIANRSLTRSETTVAVRGALSLSLFLRVCPAKPGLFRERAAQAVARNCRLLHTVCFARAIKAASSAGERSSPALIFLEITDHCRETQESQGRLLELIPPFLLLLLRVSCSSFTSLFRASLARFRWLLLSSLSLGFLSLVSARPLHPLSSKGCSFFAPVSLGPTGRCRSARTKRPSRRP